MTRRLPSLVLLIAAIVMLTQPLVLVTALLAAGLAALVGPFPHRGATGHAA